MYYLLELKEINNAEFKNVLGNSIRVKNIVAIAPRLTLFPNVLDNITRYNNQVTVNGVAYTIPAAYYTQQTFITAFNTYVAGVTIGVNLDLNNPRMYLNGAAGFIVTFKDSEMYEVLGATGDPITMIGAALYMPYPPNMVVQGNLVNLTCAELGTNQHIDRIGRTHSVLETVSLALTPRAQYAQVQRDTPDHSIIYFDEPLEISRVNFFVLDGRFRPIDIPANYNVWIQCRVWSVDK